MLAGIGPFIDDGRKRFVLSFAFILTFHAAAFYYMHMEVIISREKAKLITNVEIMQMETPKPAVVEEQPKNVWEKIKQAMPFSKAEEGPRPTAVDAMKRLLEDSTMKPEKLVDKTQPLSQLDKSRLDDLKRQRDEKLTELMDMTGGAQHKIAKLVNQEQVLTEAAKPIVRPTMGIDKSISMEEVGARRAAGNISDVIGAETAHKAAGLQAPVSQLVEKKAELRKQLAALNAAPGRLEDRSSTARPRSGDLKEIVGNMQERKTAQELLALEKLIQEKEPSKPSSHPGGGGFGFSRGSGSGLGGADAIRLNEPKVQPISRKPAVPDIKAIASSRSDATVAEIKKAPVEITGPLEKRKVLQAFVPKYPDWAKSKGIEADVSLRLFVNPKGFVTPDISVVITSGYRELDQLCIEYLKKWVFVPLEADESQADQWGVITIRFRLE